MANQARRFPESPKWYFPRPRIHKILDDVLSFDCLVLPLMQPYRPEFDVSDWCKLRSSDGSVFPLWLSLPSSKQSLSEFIKQLNRLELIIAGDNASDELEATTSFEDIEKKFDSVVSIALNQGKDFVVVIDRITSSCESGLLDVIQRLITDMHGYAHFIIICKDVGAFSSISQRALGLSGIVTGEDLTFTPAEARRYLQQGMSYAPSRSEMSKAMELTEGCPLGLSLLMMGMANKATLSEELSMLEQGQSDVVNAYLDELINKLDKENELFILETSLIGEFYPEMADYILERSNSSLLTDTLRESFFFTKENGFPVRVFRLFERSLQNRSRAHRETDTQRIVKRLLDWHIDHRDYVGCFKHIQNLNAWDYFSEIMASNGSDLLQSVIQNIHQGVSVNIDLIPKDILCNDPALTVILAATLLHRDDPTEAKKQLASARALLERQQEKQGYETLPQWILLFETLAEAELGTLSYSSELEISEDEEGTLSNPLIHSWKLLSDAVALSRTHELMKSISVLEKARELSEEIGFLFVEAVSSYFLAKQYLLNGRYLRAKETLLRTQKNMESAAYDYPPLGVVQLGNALLALEKCDTQTARSLLASATRKIREGENVEFYVDTQTALATIHLLEGNPEQAEMTLEKAAEHAERHNSYYCLYLTQCKLACAQINEYKESAAISWVKRMYESDEVFRKLHVATLTYLKIHNAQGPSDRVFEELSKLIRELREIGNIKLLLEALTLQAQVFIAKRDLTSAREAIKSAIELAAPSELMLPFLFDPLALRELIKQDNGPRHLLAFINEPKEHQFLEMILHKLNVPFSSYSEFPQQKPTSMVDSLTAREKEIFWYLLDNYSDHDIGNRLFISKSTVHAHVSSIYSKLGVHSRNEIIKDFGRTR